MKKEIAEKLVSRLRSGDFLQYQEGVLKVEEDGVYKHCVYGVLGEIYVSEGQKNKWSCSQKVYKPRGDYVCFYKWGGSAEYLSQDVFDWAGIDWSTDSDEAKRSQEIVEMNDNGESFDSIADYIEEYWEEI